MDCIGQAIGGMPTHGITMPSTRGKTGPHPNFSPPARVLIVDDTWTSGARTQSLAYALRRDGASAVAILVLGRHINPADEKSATLLEAIARPLFKPSRCALEDLPHGAPPSPDQHLA
jgi:hypothetical protein